MIRVLIIDADLNNCKRIKYALQEQSSELDAYYTLSVVEAIECLAKEGYQLVILALSLSETAGLRLLRIIRDLQPMPILALAVNDSTEQTVKAFSLGADDVLGKPFNLEECLARAQNLLRRARAGGPGGKPGYTLVCGRDLVITPLTRRAYQRGEPLDLTRREFDLLCFFVDHAGQVLTRDQLYNGVWPREASFDTEEAVRSQVKQLRKKLGTPKGNAYIETVWGVGYRFNEGRRT